MSDVNSVFPGDRKAKHARRPRGRQVSMNVFDVCRQLYLFEYKFANYLVSCATLAVVQCGHGHRSIQRQVEKGEGMI